MWAKLEQYVWNVWGFFLWTEVFVVSALGGKVPGLSWGMKSIHISPKLSWRLRVERTQLTNAQSEEHVNYFSDTCVTCAYHPIPFLLDSMTWLQFQVNFTIHDNIRSVRTGAEGTACVASRRSLRWMKNLIMIPLFCECGCAENTIESMARCVLKKVIRFRV